jgi:hypothetical protein
MNLTLFYIISGLHKNFTHDVTGQDHTLSSNACNQDIRRIIFHRIHSLLVPELISDASKNSNLNFELHLNLACLPVGRSSNI